MSSAEFLFAVQQAGRASVLPARSPRRSARAQAYAGYPAAECAYPTQPLPDPQAQNQSIATYGSPGTGPNGESSN